MDSTPRASYVVQKSDSFLCPFSRSMCACVCALLVDEKVTSIEVPTAKVQVNSIQTNIELLLAAPNQYHVNSECVLPHITTIIVNPVAMFTNVFVV